MNQHPSTAAILEYFSFEHLSPAQQRVAEPLGKIAHEYARGLQGPELTAGLRKLLEAKDCFVRASLNVDNK